MKEIGGEFYSYDFSEVVSYPNENFEYTLSGRSSLNYIINDIKKTQSVDSVLLPSYCCDSMIQPFLNNGLPVSFYNVVLDEEGIKADLSVCDKEIDHKTIVLAMDYFGFNREILSNLFEKEARCAIKIQDATHTFFSAPEHSQTDYYFASLRKWTRFKGLSVCRKTKASFSETIKNTLDEYCEERTKAADLKKEYIENGTGEKIAFLNLFNSAEEKLDVSEDTYISSDVDIMAFRYLDRENIINSRRNNAGYLISELKHIKEVELMFKYMKSEDVPLFVPILVEESKRDALRSFLISEDIYCPVHWPCTELHCINDEAKKIYDSEISLICDQRYGLGDMERIISVIKKFFKRNY